MKYELDEQGRPIERVRPKVKCSNDDPLPDSALVVDAWMSAIQVVLDRVTKERDELVAVNAEQMKLLVYIEEGMTVSDERAAALMEKVRAVISKAKHTPDEKEGGE